MNNLSSYCGSVDAKIKASDKDLPVTKSQIAQWDQNLKLHLHFFSLLRYCQGLQMNNYRIFDSIMNYW